MNYELREYSFGETIGKSFNLYFNNFLVVVIISLLLNTPALFLTLFSLQLSDTMTKSMLSLLMSLISIFTSSFLSGVLIHIISKKFLEKDIASSDYVGRILPLIFPIMGLSLLVGLVTMLGFILLIVPGIIFALAYSVAVNILVVERKKIGESMKRSWELTKGYRGMIFGLTLILMLINMAIVLPVNFLSQRIFSKEIASVIQIIASSIITPLGSCLDIVIYFNLRIKKEGFNIEHLTQQFSLNAPQEENKA